MGTLKDIINKNTDCAEGSANTGKQGCQVGFGTPKSFFKLKKGTVIPKSTDFNLAYINSLIASRTLVPVMNATDFDTMSGEDTMSTTSGGVEQLNLKGLVKYGFIFEEGHEFYRELDNLRGFKSSSVMFLDEEGNLLHAVNSDGDVIGFTVGQINPEMTKRRVEGGDAESKKVTIQLLNRKQTDKNYGIIKAAQLGFDAIEEVNGINGATFVYDSIPSAGTNIDAKLVLNSDMNTEVRGITSPGEITVEINGVGAVASAVSETNGVYSITCATLSTSDIVKVYLTGVYTASGVMYAKGGDAKESVV